MALGFVAAQAVAQPVPGSGVSRKPNPMVEGPGIADSTQGCKAGFVRRAASPADLVCVPPEAKSRVANENRTQNRTREANGACKPGFVWREAFAGDAVCVPPPSRDLAREENRLDASRRAP